MDFETTDRQEPRARRLGGSPWGERGRAGRIQLADPWSPDPGGTRSSWTCTQCPRGRANFSQPAGRAQRAAQVSGSRAGSAPAPRTVYLPGAPGRPAPRGQAGAGGLRKLPRPTSARGYSRPLLTWPEDSSGDQEAEDQTAGGGRLRCHIPPPPPPPRESPTESAPQEREGASFPTPRCPRTRGSVRRGQPLLADTPPPRSVGAAPSGLRGT